MLITSRMTAAALAAFAMIVAAASLSYADEAAKAVDAPFRVAHDAPLDVAERVVTQTDGYAQYRIEFNGIESGSRVPAFVYVPKDGKDKHPAVLLQYGSGGNKSTNYITELGRQFVGRGFVVLTIDVPNRGERRGEGSARRGLAGMFAPGTILQTLGDYSRAIDYLSSRADVDTDRIGYTGISLGAITGLTFVAHEPRVRAMASIVGGANLLGTLKVELDPSVKKIAEKVDPFYHVAQIAPRPLLLLNATRDQLVPRFFGEQLHKAAGEKAKKVWIETDHFFRGVDRHKVLDTVIDFMEESLTAA
jgi:dienelactone hydrolase